jgi:uncharacterized protein
VADIDLPEADPPSEFDEYTLVLLYRGANPPQLSEQESDRLQRQHLGHLESMHKRGVLLVHGPFSEQPDDNFRGLCVYGTGLEEARRLAESDPAVRRGRLRIVAFKWYTPKSALQANPRPSP